jgi:hypothetical protein
MTARELAMHLLRAMAERGAAHDDLVALYDERLTHVERGDRLADLAELLGLVQAAVANGAVLAQSARAPTMAALIAVADLCPAERRPFMHAALNSALTVLRPAPLMTAEDVADRAMLRAVCGGGL